MNTINIIIVNPLFIVIFFGGLISVLPTVSILRKKDSNSDPVAGYYGGVCALVSAVLGAMSLSLMRR